MRPVFRYLFTYMEEHYDVNFADNGRTRFYLRDILENQYAHLDGPVNSEITTFPSPEDAAELVTKFAKTAGANLERFISALKGGWEHSLIQNGEYPRKTNNIQEGL